MTMAIWQPDSARLLDLPGDLQHLVHGDAALAGVD